MAGELLVSDKLMFTIFLFFQTCSLSNVASPRILELTNAGFCSKIVLTSFTAFFLTASKYYLDFNSSFSFIEYILVFTAMTLKPMQKGKSRL